MLLVEVNGKDWCLICRQNWTSDYELHAKNKDGVAVGQATMRLCPVDFFLSFFTFFII